MKFTIQFLGTLACLAIVALAMTGCAAGVRLLGEIEVSKGYVKKYVQIGTKGHDSARITVIESFIVVDKKVEPSKTYEATTDGLVGKIVQGTGAAAMGAGGQIGAAYLRRPDLYNNTTVQTDGNVSTATSTATQADSLSEGSHAGALAIGKGGRSSSNSSSRSKSEAEAKNLNFNKSNSSSRSSSSPSVRVYNNNDLKNLNRNSNSQHQGQGQQQGHYSGKCEPRFYAWRDI